MAFKPELSNYAEITKNAIEHYLKNQETQDMARVALAFLADEELWKGLVAVPPDSPLDKVIRGFERETDIPLILPFCGFMHLVSAYLIKKKVVFDLYGTIKRPAIWTVVLAPSGSGKTLSVNVLEKMSSSILGVQSEFADVKGGAAFVDELEMKNGSFWLADEFAQTLQHIETTGHPMNDCKEYLLKMYSGGKVERKTKKETVTIKDPCLVILGLNTFDSFINKISEESLTDGFSQRFSYLIAELDPKRPITKFPIYKLNSLNERIKEAFQAIASLPLHSHYTFSEAAVLTYEEAFGQMYAGAVDGSFYRRLMFLSFAYALIYHIVLGKDTAEIDAQDMGWALRLVRLHMQDLKKILQAKNFGALEKIVQKCEEMLRTNPGKFTPRTIVQNIRGVETTARAKQIYDFVMENERRRNLTGQQQPAGQGSHGLLSADAKAAKQKAAMAAAKAAAAEAE